MFLSFIRVFPIIGLLMGIPQDNKGECFAEIIRFQALLENPTGRGNLWTGCPLHQDGLRIPGEQPWPAIPAYN